MHQSFYLTRLDVLPLSMKRLGLLACRGTATQDHLDRLVDFFHRRASDNQKAAFLPICYHLLDPKLIPATAISLNGDVPLSDSDKETLQRSCTFLNVLLHLQAPPPKAGADIWPRAFAWFWLYHNSWHVVASVSLDIKPDAMLYIDFVYFASQFIGSATSTPGFRSVFVAAWKYLPSVEEDLPRQALLGSIYRFLFRFRSETPENVAELVDAAGSLEALAGLTVELLGAVSRCTNIAGDSNLSAIDSILAFIVYFDDRSSIPPDAPGRSELPDVDRSDVSVHTGLFMHSFIAQDGVAAIVFTILGVLSRAHPSAEVEAADVLLHSFVLLERMIGFGTRLCLHAMESGLLEAIGLALTSPYVGQLKLPLCRLLTSWIPMDLIHSYTARTILRLRAAAETTVGREKLRQSVLFGYWKIFSQWADKAAGDLDNVVLNKARNHRSCEYLQCNRIDDRTRFKKCSSCKAAYYCSKACQRKDWREGNHRVSCPAYSRLFISQHIAHQFRFKDRVYLRGMINNDYEARLREITKQQLKFMTDNPGYSDVLVTIFQYTAAPMQIRVASIDEMTRRLEDENTFNSICDEAQRNGWWVLVNRARDKRELFHLFVAEIYTLDEIQYLLVPVRFQEDIAYKTLLDRVRAGCRDGLAGGFM